MTWDIPKIQPSKHGRFPIITFDVVDSEGATIRTRNPSIDEVFKYLRVEAVVDAYNERADFDLWLAKKHLPRSIPGQWRGDPNPYAVKDT